jgi:hypothetical protein
VSLWDFITLGVWLGGWASLIVSDFVIRRRVELSTLCDHCRYELTGLPTDRPCPECGTIRNPSRHRLRGTTVRRWASSAGYAVPFGIPATFVLLACTGAFGGSPSNPSSLAMLFLANHVPYVLIHLAALAVGRFYSDRTVCVLALSASISGMIGHVYLLLDAFVWNTDPLNFLAIPGATMFVLPVAGYGMLIAACVLSRRRG